jgi:predicted nucleic acid-binding protein
MAILVDTNVILDVVTNDPKWADWAIESLEAHEDLELSINPAIYAELCFGYDSAEQVDDLIKRFGFRYEEIPRAGLHRAAQAFRKYRARGGTKAFVLPDFFIGGHAEAANHRLMTRDLARYQSYFPKVSIISP